MSKYIRVLIRGSLTTRSALHIGTGQQSNSTDADTQESNYNTLCLDAQQKPYIPASTMRGYLRHIISTYEDRQKLETLFGSGKQGLDAADTGNSGLLRVYDAPLRGIYRQRIISKTSIDPVSNTAKEHHLASHEMVEANSQFELLIELDHVSSEQLTLVLKALNTFSPAYAGQLGAAKSSGQGYLEWYQHSLKVLEHKQFKKWLTTANKKLDNFYQDYTDVAEINALIDSKQNAYQNKLATFSYQLLANSPLLIVDAIKSKQESKQRKEHNQNQENQTPLFEADLVFMQQHDQALIPGSTLKGWLRARCRKILLSLLRNTQNTSIEDAESIATERIEQLFGNTDKQGLLHFSDATASFTQDDLHQQTFNAIDRFSGGVKDGALFNVEAILPQQPFSASIRYPQNLPEWANMLLLYALADIARGELRLGWGKSRGFGQLALQTEKYSNWQDFINTLDKNTLTQWQTAFEEILQTDPVSQGETP